MKYQLLAICFYLFTANCIAQKSKKINMFAMANYNNTIADHTLGNNPWGMGFGLQAFLNNKCWIKPTAELTGDLYLLDDKVYRTNTDGSEAASVGAMVNLFVGAAFQPIKYAYISYMVGPSFIHGQTLFGLKPSIGFYFPSNQKFTCKFSYINILNRYKPTNTNFTSWSIAFGLQLFNSKKLALK